MPSERPLPANSFAIRDAIHDGETSFRRVLHQIIRRAIIVFGNQDAHRVPFLN